jgi:indolepyruvate ferredoxin oxidoreductase beta subunit
MSATRPLAILIAALGGEGGGVLTNWIVAAAEAHGLPVQSTSIPGVAQRTGATTYYIEIVPTPWHALGQRRPVLALVPGIGDIDILVASEALEASRQVAAGFATRARTLVIASTHRVLSMAEKTAMGDGRLDSEKMLAAITAQAAEALLLDIDRLARDNAAMINAVMLGLMVGSGRLPVPDEVFEAAIRADGKAVEANVRGFHAGLAAARERRTPAPVATAMRASLPTPDLGEIERQITGSVPAPAREIMIEGARRLARYQDVGYARLYVERLRPIAEADRATGMAGRLLAETARHLALRMSFEDLIRVAQEKTDPGRFQRIAREKGIGSGDLMTVTEFLKPGIEELCSILPPALARRILALSERRGWLGRVHWGMEIESTTITGFLKLSALARLRWWRPRSLRWQEEQAAIDGWLGLVREAGRRSGEFALEVAELARLIKGYGDTHKRGTASYQMIEARVVRPALAGGYPVTMAIDAIASARAAALADPEGVALGACIAEVERRVASAILSPPAAVAAG